MKFAEPLAASPSKIDGLWHLRWSPSHDERGSVQPVYVSSQIEGSPLPRFTPAQANLTRSQRGVIRGVHGESLNKLVAVLAGRVFAVGVDLRKESSTFGQHVALELGPDEGLFISSGLGNAFQSVSKQESLYLYLFDSEWHPGMPGVHVNPLDAALGIDWPIRDSIKLSEKDRSLPGLKEVSPSA